MRGRDTMREWGRRRRGRGEGGASLRVPLVAVWCALMGGGCAESASQPARGGEAADVAGIDCDGVACGPPDGGLPDAAPADTTPSRPDDPDVAPEGGDVEEAEDVGDPMLDVSDGTEGGITSPAPEPLLFRVCESDSECPWRGTACVRDVRTTGGSGPARAIPIAALLPTHVGPGQGICTHAAGNCGALAAGACATLESVDGAPWTCMLVASDDPWADLTADGFARDAVHAAGWQEALRAGGAWASLCRPPATLLARDGAICERCEDDCPEGHVCEDPGSAWGARRTTARRCLPVCTFDEDCPIGFSCEGGEREAAFCVPVAGDCDECRDLDGDGHGSGRCAGADGASPVDCDDHDPLVFHDPGRPVDAMICGAGDRNCDGLDDAQQLTGPHGAAPSRHCTTCGDACTLEKIGVEPGLANSAARCVNSELGPLCVLGCEELWADCDELPANGCETSLQTRDDCGGCDVSCVLDATARAETACRVDAFSQTAYCRVESCADGYADCDGMFVNGCEAHLASDLAHCGGCGEACPASLPQASVACDVGVCAIGACASGWADCDGSMPNGCEQSIRDDVAHCGACSLDCRVAPGVDAARCDAGTCSILSCRPGLQDCDGDASTGCESVTSTDRSNCGACGNDCGALPNVAQTACEGGGCRILACTPGWSDCDGQTANGCERRLGTGSDCTGCGDRCDASRYPDALVGVCGANDDTFVCACTEPAGTVTQRCDGRATRCGQGVDEGCPAAVSIQRSSLRTATVPLCHGCGANLPTLNPVTCAVQGGAGEALRSAGTCAGCGTCAQSSAHCCPDDTLTQGLLSHLSVSFVRDLRRDATLGPEVNRVAFHWYDEPIPVEPRGTLDALGDYAAYRIVLSGVATLARGTLGRAAAQTGSLTETLRCDADGGELITGLGFFVDGDGGLKGLAIQCRAFELARTLTGTDPAQRYRPVAVGAPRWVTTSHYSVEHLPLGSTIAHRIADPWTGKAVLNRVVFGSASTNNRTHGGLFPLAGGVSAVIGQHASGPVPAVESWRFDWVQVGYMTTGANFRVTPRNSAMEAP